MVELETESVDEGLIDQSDVDKKTIEKRVIILMKEANLSVLLVTTGILLRGDQEEVVEKNAEFDNSEILKE